MLSYDTVAANLRNNSLKKEKNRNNILNIWILKV